MEIDALAGGVGCQQHAHLRVVAEGLLRGVALFAAQSAVNDHDCLFSPQPAGDALMQVAECVAVFGEDNQFLLGRGHGVGNGTGTVGGGSLGERADEQLVEQLPQLEPLSITSAPGGRVLHPLRGR